MATSATKSGSSKIREPEKAVAVSGVLSGVPEETPGNPKALLNRGRRATNRERRSGFQNASALS